MLLEHDRREFNPWLTDWPPPEYDITKHAPGFETEQKAQDERERRIEVLLQGEHRHRMLGYKLATCSDNQRCILSICPLCMRRARIWIVAEMLRKPGFNSNLIAVTLMSTKDLVNEKRLNSLLPNTVFERYRKQLSRNGASTSIIGGFDMSHEADFSAFHGHLHLVMHDSQRHAIEPFRDMLGKTHTGANPVYIQEIGESIEDKMAVFSYAAKAFCRSRIRIEGTKKVIKRRMPPHQHREWLLWLSKFTIPSLMFFYRTRRRANKIVNHNMSLDL